MAKPKANKLALDLETLRALDMVDVRGGVAPKQESFNSRDNCPTTQSLHGCPPVV